MPAATDADDLVWVRAVTRAPTEFVTRLAYADWLEERDDPRGDYLRKLVAALQSDTPAKLPDATGIDPEWHDLMGGYLAERMTEPMVWSRRLDILALTRTALRLEWEKTTDDAMPVGATKRGGLPDLPEGSMYPRGRDCHATYNDETAHVKELAEFVAQINLSDVAGTAAASHLPASGWLSFFAFIDTHNDKPDCIGAMVKHIPVGSQLIRTNPASLLPAADVEEGENDSPTYTPPVQTVCRLAFVETLDIPESLDGDQDSAVNEFQMLNRERNYDNLLGYGRSTTSDTWTSPKYRPLLRLPVSERVMHLGLRRGDLAHHRWEKLVLDYVDFD